MKRKILYILILLLLGHGVLFIGFKYLSSKKSEPVLQLSHYLQKSAPPKVLVLGDSHAERGLDFSQLPGTSSLAYYGENNVMNYYKLKYCVENGVGKIKYVILPCDIVTFSKGFNEFRSNKYFYYSLVSISELKNFEKRICSSYYEYLKARLFPYAEWQYGLNLGEAERIHKGKRKFSDHTEMERKANARYFIQTEMGCNGKQENLFYKTSLSYLEKTLEFCRQNNIKPIFVRYPLTQELFNEVKEGISESCLKNRPAEEALRAQNIPVLDFENVLSKNADLFFDCHHLNTEGRKIFTPLFKEKLDSLLRVY